ncbi:fam-a protein [Plasmodium chabaudi chabaudi]|uniref:Fam-a protein n=1 Tax=Plasmodium chabaudi chabaudi TaxID=31271 RepID=A0A1D3L9P3_PLACU|nr:fam-a protein [Plasmodium chabaudi chabaudi]
MNKFYIQFVLYLLSIFIYSNNKTLATEPDPGEDEASQSTDQKSTSEKRYEKDKPLVCINPIINAQAVELMDEAVKQFKYHATYIDGYERWSTNTDSCLRFYKKELEDNTLVEKIEYSIWDSVNFSDIVSDLWDSDNPTFFNAESVKRKVVRVYNPDLIMIQQRYKTWFGGREKYFYALATKVEVTKYITFIVMTSVNVVDKYPSNKEYKNKIIEKANSFKTVIDNEEDIRKGKLKKTFVNIAGYYIQKYNQYVDVTFVASIDGHACI